jgi:hypothetical protein
MLVPAAMQINMWRQTSRMAVSPYVADKEC